MIALATHLGVDIPDDVRIFFVAAELMSNKVGADAEYAQTGKYKGTDLGRIMTWDDMKHDNGTIPVRINDKLLTSDEAAVAHIAHECYELTKFEQANRWTLQEFIKQTAAPAGGGRQENLHSQAWSYADKIVNEMRKMRDEQK